MKKIELRADCANCAALCCMALAFDRSALFAIDKPAGQACLHLDACGACAIHDARAARGFSGCVRFDCLGAAQRVTQAFFGGRNWMEDRSLVGPMSRAFGILLRAHAYLALLNQAATIHLAPPDRQTLIALRAALEDAGACAEDIDALRLRVDDFLSRLRPYVEGKALTASRGRAVLERSEPPRR
jgi:hypothetical protein